MARKLCPVCRCHYFDSTILDNGDLVYYHREWRDGEGEVHLQGCIVTDNSVIRGVEMRPRGGRRRGGRPG